MVVTPEAMVSGPEQLAARLRSWLGNDTARHHILARQRLALPDAAAITQHYLDELSPYLAATHE
jgi:hypothetical protein